MNELTINNLIKTLKVEGKGTKKKVLLMLENASISDLLTLRNSINEKIRTERGEIKCQN
ncbi:MAG: hypothetical protein ACI4WW_02795 [Candidatus Coprovivens sp.]